MSYLPLRAEGAGRLRRSVERGAPGGLRGANLGEQAPAEPPKVVRRELRDLARLLDDETVMRW